LIHAHDGRLIPLKLDFDWIHIMLRQMTHISTFHTAATDNTGTPVKIERRRWSTPRVIVAEIESTKAGVANIPEASGGLLTS
jgi:hypothetical protein